MNDPEMALRHRFAERVKARRAELGLSQAALAERLGMHQPDLCDLENAKHAPTLETVDRFAASLDVDPSYFISEKMPESGLTA